MNAAPSAEVRRRRRRARRGSTLLELVVAAGLLATVMTAMAALLRISEGTWQSHDNYLTRVESAHAVVRHITRSLQQAIVVQAISAPTDDSGSLTAVGPTGDVLVWDHAGGNVSYGINTADSLLAENIETLTFTGYEIDGATATTTPSAIRLIQMEVGVTPAPTAGTRTVSGYVWLRAW
jgi:type II secretory pathway pseudopilin PulG